MNAGHDERDDDLDGWLAQLAGRGGTEDATATRLRRVVLARQAADEDGIDDLRLRRGRTRLLEAAKRQRRAIPRTPRFLAVAASALLALGGTFFTYEMLQTTREYEQLMAYGELERPRGSFPTLTVMAADPEATGRRIGRALVTARVPFELVAAPGDGVRLMVVAGDGAARDALATALAGFELEIKDEGYYVVVIEPANPG